MDQRSELRGLSLAGPSQEQPHGHGREGSDQPQHDPHHHHAQQRRLCVQGHLAHSVVRGRGDEGPQDSESLKHRRVRGAVRCELRHRPADGEESLDQPTLLLELRDDLPIRADGPDGDRGVGALHREDGSTVQERVRGMHQQPRVGLGVCAGTLDTKEDILDVSLGQGALPRGDVHDQGLVAFAVGGAGVVRDDGDDQDQEGGDPGLQPAGGTQPPQDGRSGRDRSPSAVRLARIGGGLGGGGEVGSHSSGHRAALSRPSGSCACPPGSAPPGCRTARSARGRAGG